MSPVSERRFNDLLNRLEITSNQTLNRPAIGLARDRQIGPERSVATGNVELPAHPKQREALFQQKTIAKLGLGLGVQTSGSEVEKSEHALPAPVGHFIEDRSVSAAGIFRFDEIEIRGKLHFAGRSLGRIVDIGDDPVRAVLRIDSKIDRPGQLLIGAGRAECFAGKQIGAIFDFDADDFSAE